MSIQVRYMGAKHNLAPVVAEIISGLPPGPCLDLFAGMCSVAGALSATGRSAWCNDIQRYAALVSRALVTSTESPISGLQASEALLCAFKRNSSRLGKRFRGRLKDESIALQRESYLAYNELAHDWRHAGNDSKIASEVISLMRSPKAFPYRLITLTYSHGYFGLRQAIDLDSIKYAIDGAHRSRRITFSQTQQCMAALIQTASKICSAPGHFAQYLTVKNRSTYDYIRRMRRRDAWEVFRSSLDTISPYGTSQWRAQNRTFCRDAIRLLGELPNIGHTPRIVYADPPYSEAQYSRYYHVLESLVRYDYPTVTGKGRYREGRFTTPFSLASGVSQAFAKLSARSAKMGADLVISYPSNGFLFQHGGDLASILRERYSKLDVVKINHTHSTLGGRHGPMNSNVEEMIFVARRPR
jgi:adenine-specific DNA-methyltransferase